MKNQLRELTSSSQLLCASLLPIGLLIGFISALFL